MSKTKTVVDHLGNVYRSKQELCRHYKVPLATFSYRMARGFSLESALTSKKRVDVNHIRFKFILKHPDYVLYWEKYNSMC